MRAWMIVAALTAGTALVAPASAQSPLDGPLAAPDAAAPAKPATAGHHAKAKPRKHAAKSASSPTTAEVPQAVPAAAPGKAAPGDALDLGMKWNGSNDTAAQTRFQNGPNNAFGSGAEVGMKLHF